ncbi:thiolproteinase SmTP1, putative [Perkinsus marinus ATCC 50983]|uniref:Thiolproteinase SmTP1, putative n=1 Tax=Perkinsus marinus (strain ATCC 50983 / TXsc) TaxID=423536 RepID=C5L6Q2_PERM5|nr:thiolproteinase SmTP1, putative [Perkinsus marinus ATCC 50983]EER07591.1 thiolproteinase SmTP1, putative [Perkinsus marinus ATCC 50983]|eukprot:XP_002775775.1 thiolproteinase SmTP1, putative [Perkinsus marinus ATCC 50983]
MESRFKLKTGISKVVQFSVQQIVDCSRPSGNFGCLGGQSLYAYDYAKAQGMVKESSYPYKAKESACKTSITSNPEKQCLKKGDINQLLPIDRHDELKMMEALTTGPVTASICATCPAFKAYKSGVLTAAACGKGDVDHTITMVGYGTASDGTPYWKIMNSWGKSWGMKGFALLQRTGPSIPRDTCGVLAGNHLYPVYADTVMSSVCAKK